MKLPTKSTKMKKRKRFYKKMTKTMVRSRYKITSTLPMSRQMKSASSLNKRNLSRKMKCKWTKVSFRIIYNLKR